MISASPHSIARSSLEEMLDSLRRRDEGEHSKDLPPALPSRPTSKARLPKRLIQAKLAMEHAGSYDASRNKKHEVKCVTGGNGRKFGEKKDAAAAGEERLMEYGGATLATTPETEWNRIIDYCVKHNLVVWWKPPQKDLWELVKIKATMGEEASVTLSDGSAFTISTGELLPANTENLDVVDDLVQLCYLNEPSVLHNLKYRYNLDVIYTKAGHVLLAINPFKEVKIYGNDFVTAYKEKTLNKPHVYAMADAAYHDMMKDGGNQSIIISGESGSGKTETSKFAMQYLASVGSQNDKTKTKLDQANCVLEAFGNAKTSKNLNSSRFGKLIDISYNAEGIISGASIQTLLLEKSRVSRLRRGERSYHVFYQICAGAPPILKDVLNLKMASEYKFLNQSGCLKINGVDDGHNFIMLVDAFDTFGIPHEVQESVFELVAAILWLGNISFGVIDKEEHVVPVADEASRSAARLMGCKMDDLIELLSTNRINNTTMPLALQQATVKRDALAKYIYESLFNWLVEEINTSLKGDKHHARNTISIIDIYGFESFQKNSFPQLFINYADQKLQQHFVRHLCKLEQEKYDLDGIHWKNVESEDNQECLDLFEQRPMGLISILDEGSNSSKATDETFTDKIKRHLSSNSRFRCEKGTFRIHHYAGEVLYDASGLLEQNSDKLQFDIIQLLSSCKKPLNHLASGLVKQDQTTSQSVFVKFKDHLFKIIQQLENSKQHFIRCIKPNTKQFPGNFENGIVWKQLKCSQVMDILQISRSRYPISFTHQEFATRFGCLLSDNLISMDSLSTSVAILQQHSVPTQTYQVGSSKLFFQGQVDVLENLRQEVLKSTHEVENGFLGSQVLPDSEEWKFGVVILQSFVRGENARREFKVLKKQNRNQNQNQNQNQGIAPSSLDEHLTTIVHLQSVVRGWLARKYFNHMQRWKKSAIDSSRSSRRSHSKNSELKGSSQDNIQVLPQNVEELQKRVAKAESLLRERDLENTALREQVRQFEIRMSEYENKTKAVEEMWQSQMASLQMSLAAAKKTLSSGISDGQIGRPDGSASPNYYDSEDISGIPTPVQMTPLRSGHNRRENGIISNTVDYLSKEFEQRKQTFDNDAKAVINATPGRLPPSKQIEDYKSLKKKFEIWKKEYKHRLREAKTTLVNGESGGGGVSAGGDRRGRTWWGRLSKRGKERIV